MLSARAVLCLTLLASGLGFAQAPATTAPPLVPATGLPEAQPPPGELIPHTGEDADEPQGPSARLFDPAFDRTNMAFEALGGLAAGVGVSLGGALIYTARHREGSCGEDEGLCQLAAIVYTYPFVALSLPLGVWTVGKLLGGQGRFLPTLGGMAVGLVAALPSLFVASDSLLVLEASFVLLPLAGSIIGYELSRPGPSRLSEHASTGSGLVPVLGFTPNGGVLGGFAARF